MVKTILHVSFYKSKIDIANSGTQGLNTFLDGKYDLLILDLGLPDIDGYEILKDIRNRSTIPVLILTVRDAEENIIRAFEIGADEYIVKPFRHLEFLARIGNLLKRYHTVRSDETLVINNLELDCVRGDLIYLGEHLRLTRTETLIMKYLIKDTNEIVTYKQIADLIWGREYHGSRDIIRVYISNIKKKLSRINKDNDLINNYPGLGYKLTVDKN